MDPITSQIHCRTAHRRVTARPDRRTTVQARTGNAAFAFLALKSAVVLGMLLLTGCSGRNRLIGGGASSSQMKESLSHLQFDNEQLRTEVAKLKEETRGMEDRLVQEQLHNGDLTARLDDARNLLRDKGIESDTRLGSRSRGEAANLDDDGAGPRTLPAGRSTAKRRKPPAANIPGDLDDLPTASDRGAASADTISFKSPATGSSRKPRSRDESDSIVIDDDELHWQPVATAPGAQPSPRR